MATMTSTMLAPVCRSPGPTFDDVPNLGIFDMIDARTGDWATFIREGHRAFVLGERGRGEVPHHPKPGTPVRPRKVLPPEPDEHETICYSALPSTAFFVWAVPGPEHPEGLCHRDAAGWTHLESRRTGSPGEFAKDELRVIPITCTVVEHEGGDAFVQYIGSTASHAGFRISADGRTMTVLRRELESIVRRGLFELERERRTPEREREPISGPRWPVFRDVPVRKDEDDIRALFLNEDGRLLQKNSDTTALGIGTRAHFEILPNAAVTLFSLTPR